jgi:hypothetical protein
VIQEKTQKEYAQEHACNTTVDDVGWIHNAYEFLHLLKELRSWFATLSQAAKEFYVD